MERTYGREFTIRDYLNRVFGKMCIGLLVTALVSYMCAATGLYYKFVMVFGGLGSLLLFAVEMVVSWKIARHVFDYDSSTANFMFYIFAGINGFSLSSLFYAYNIGTLFTAFLFTAVLFGCFMIIGKFTNVDMSRFSGLLTGGLMALLVCSLLSFFIPMFRANMMIDFLGLILFFALTVWNIQSISRMYYSGGAVKEGLSTYGALSLYLDFINIFVRVLSLMARYGDDQN